MTIALVTDSTADISASLAAEYDIHIVPAILVMDGRSLEDGQGISREQLYQQLPLLKVSPTTASPSSGTFHALYADLLKSGAESIISIHVSSVLSGIYNAAKLAARGFGSRIQVIDSRHVTLGLGYQVIAAARAIRAGVAAAEIERVVDEIRQHIHLVAMLDTLEYVRRSGRISWARSNLGALLQLKPFVGVEDGKVTRLGESRTRQKGILRLAEMLQALGPIKDLTVLHSNAQADAVQFAERFKSSVEHYPLIVNVTSIIGIHVGPNGLGFVALTE